MNGETNLQILLRNIQPELHDSEFVFCTIEPAARTDLRLSPIGQFSEVEGLTLVLSRAEAEANKLDFSYPCRMITLKVHSSLDAVGFLAAVSVKLAQRGISVNVISGFFHDHLFVPVGRVDEAMTLLNDGADGTV